MIINNNNNNMETLNLGILCNCNCIMCLNCNHISTNSIPIKILKKKLIILIPKK